MATTLSNLNTIINDRRRETGSNSIDMTGDGFRAINGVLDIWNQSHEWEWQIQESIVNYHEGITRYIVPSSGTTSIYKAPVNMKYYKSEKTKEFGMVSNSSFDSDVLTERRFSIESKNQKEYLRIKASGENIVIDPADQLTSNGTWVGTSAVSNVATDSYEFFEENGSVSFDYSGTSGTLTKTLTSGVDLSKYKNRSDIYWNHKCSTYTNWTSMTLKLGTDSSNYYTASVTSDYLSETPTANQWNKFKISWSSFTTVGNPTITNMSYVQLTIAYSVNPSAAMWIENFFASVDLPIVFEYYSTDMVYDVSAGAKLQNFNDSSATTDYPLWSGKWDFVKEAFVNSVLENIFWIVGDYNDMTVATNKIKTIVDNLKQKFPSRRRYAEMSMKFDTD